MTRFDSRCLTRLAAIVVLVALGTAPAPAQEKTAEQGVYTSAQAARGEKTFDTHCVTCHREPGGTAPVLAGDRFTTSFGDATLQSVFTTIKTTMPRQAPATLTDPEYTDIVAHLLRLNGYADGMSELALADLPAIKIPGQSGSLDQALVQVAGCLARNGRNWTLSAATDPTRTRDPEAAKDDEAAQLDARPAGTRTFRLQQVYGAPAGWTNQKVAAKGFLSASGTEDRITVTSLRALATPCGV